MRDARRETRDARRAGSATYALGASDGESHASRHGETSRARAPSAPATLCIYIPFAEVTAKFPAVGGICRQIYAAKTRTGRDALPTGQTGAQLCPQHS